MRLWLMLFVVALLGGGVLACGGASKGAVPAPGSSSNAASASGTGTATRSSPPTMTTPVTATPGDYLKTDEDSDPDDKHPHVKASEGDDAEFMNTYGKEAGRADKQAIVSLVKGYYAAAAAGDGAKACQLLHSGLATALVQGQGGGACAAVVSRLLESQHEQLVADEVATMVVVDVHARGDLGVASLGFRAKPMAEIIVKRERGAWKIDALFDSEIT